MSEPLLLTTITSLFGRVLIVAEEKRVQVSVSGALSRLLSEVPLLWSRFLSKSE